jgi:HlyD family secretion protein
MFSGVINEIRLSPTTSNNVVTYTTIITTDNKDLKLKPGMTATITIYTHEVNNTLLIPVKAIKFTPDSSVNKKFEVVYIKNEKSLPPKPPAGTKAPDMKSMPANGKMPDDKTSTVATDSTATVWVKQDKKIVQKNIRTGLNNNTQVEVLEGLSATDEVITSASELKASETKSDASSPFMPKRPSGSMPKPN